MPSWACWNACHLWGDMQLSHVQFHGNNFISTDFCQSPHIFIKPCSMRKVENPESFLISVFKVVFGSCTATECLKSFQLFVTSKSYRKCILGKVLDGCTNTAMFLYFCHCSTKISADQTKRWWWELLTYFSVSRHTHKNLRFSVTTTLWFLEVF